MSVSLFDAIILSVLLGAALLGWYLEAGTDEPRFGRWLRLAVGILFLWAFARFHLGGP